MIGIGQRERAYLVPGYSQDGETFCWSHLPERPCSEHVSISEFGGFELLRGESDTFQRCSRCLCLLDVSLTTDGVQYEFDQVSRSLRSGDWSKWPDTCKLFDDTFYAGSPGIQPLRDTASLLLDYSLTPLQRRVVEAFLHVSQTD